MSAAKNFPTNYCLCLTNQILCLILGLDTRQPRAGPAALPDIEPGKTLKISAISADTFLRNPNFQLPPSFGLIFHAICMLVRRTVF